MPICPNCHHDRVTETDTADLVCARCGHEWWDDEDSVPEDPWSDFDDEKEEAGLGPARRGEVG